MHMILYHLYLYDGLVLKSHVEVSVSQKVSKNGQELEWSYVKLVETRMGSDGLVRSARIKLHNTELERPIVKLGVLEEAAHADTNSRH